MDRPWRFGAPSGEVYPPPGIAPCSPYGFPGDDPRRYHLHPHLPPPHDTFSYPDPRTTQFAARAPLPRLESAPPFIPSWQQPPFHDDVLEGGGFFKRARVGDIEVPFDHASSSRASMEEARRLNLIRSHGQQWPGDGSGAGATVLQPGHYRGDVGTFHHIFHNDSQRHLDLEFESISFRKRPFSELGSQFLSGGQEGFRKEAVATPPRELGRLYFQKSSEVGRTEWQRPNNNFNAFQDSEYIHATEGHANLPLKSSSSQGYQEEMPRAENHHQHWVDGYMQAYSGNRIMSSLHPEISNGNHNVHEAQRKQFPAERFPPGKSHFAADNYHMDAHPTSTSEGFEPRCYNPSQLSKYKLSGPYSNEIHGHPEPLETAATEMDSLSYLGSRQSIEASRPVTDAPHANRNYPPPPLQRFPYPPPEPSFSHFRDSTSTTRPMILPHSNSANLSPPRPTCEANIDGRSSSRAFLRDIPSSHQPSGFESKAHKTPRPHFEEVAPVQSKQFQEPKLTIVDASHLFKKPHRNTRPDRIVIILRGLPGSGKSYMAKVVRDLEVEHGGSAPRIHSIDDYFMTEVEKEEDADVQRSSGSSKSKKSVAKIVMEYCYEPEMEEAYRGSMLKAYKKTLDEGNFTVVIVDDRNLRVADFAQFWAVGKRAGYEVYLLESTYTDPTGCAARNVHGFSLADIQKMAEKWEDAPTLYMRIDAQSLFHGDDLGEHDIQEVDMDLEDSACDERDTSSLQGERKLTTEVDDDADFTPGGRWATDAEDEEAHVVKELTKSKWSKDFNDDTGVKHEPKGYRSALSGLMVAYGQNDKSVRWGDQVDNGGFSIGTSRNSGASLLIGPGSGYNLNSNPLLEEESVANALEKQEKFEPRKRSVFLEHLRAERESFKAVFDRRRQRIGIGGIDEEEN